MAIPSVYWLSAHALSTMRENAPFDTGNLRDLGIWMDKTGKNEFTIFIGGTEAPYAVYTNEAWVAPYWKGKKNPNEHWIDKAVKGIVDDICGMTGGRLASTVGEEDRWVNKSYWESPEGIERLERYRISDYKSAVS